MAGKILNQKPLMSNSKFLASANSLGVSLGHLWRTIGFAKKGMAYGGSPAETGKIHSPKP